jgi:diguanylate cyclase (GGDEF)-like protein
VSLHWSVYQLTDYLTEVSGQVDEPRATQVAAERVAEALDAEMSAVIVREGVTSCVGFGEDEPPPDLLTIARAHGSLDVPGLGALHTAAAALGRDGDDFLVVARSGEPLTADELQVLHGMAHMLGLALRGIRTLEAERTMREEREREAQERLALLTVVQERQRLVETLLEIQRTISGRKPLPEVLDTITAGASGLFDGWAVALVLTEPLNPELHLVASVFGRRVCDDTTVRAAGAVAISGARTVSLRERCPEGGRTLIAAPVLVEGEVAGSLVADLPDWTGHDEQRENLLAAFAQQVSLALTDARIKEAMHEAFHDPLTGLANRRLFFDLLDHAFATSDPATRDLTVVYIDLDGFKGVNDSWGHQVGDDLLRHVADRISGCLRDGDTAARLGGDEFVVLLMDAGQDVGIHVADRIISAIREPFTVRDREVFIGASVGVAQRCPSCESPADLLADGDVAMYRAKQAGRGRIVVFEQGMQVSIRQRMDLQSDLRGVRGFEEFRLQYQPIIELSTGTPIGVEALLRWNHPGRGAVPPTEFIPVAEETGVIRDLGRWALERSARQIGEWRRVIPGLRLSVNVSARQIGARRFPDEVAEILGRTGLPGDALTLELTETALMNDLDSVPRNLEDLRGLGVQVAVDDFGTGHASLAYLRRFRVDELKIDRSFIEDVTRSPHDLALVRAVIDLAGALRLRTVAEGIGRADQLATLRDLGCGFGQGFLLARPLDPDVVVPYLSGGDGAEHRPAGGDGPARHGIPRQAGTGDPWLLGSGGTGQDRS